VSDDLTYGKYRLVQRLAYGGMAEVFLARASGAAGFEKNVVIKRLHPQFCADRDFVTMLIDEAHIASQLTHTNICQVLDLGEVDGTYYLALEYIDGKDLFTIMRRLRRGGEMLPIQAAVYVVNELLEGLGFAHRKKGEDGRPLGIVHRDVSPQNVLVTSEGEVKIIDFGIAKARISSSKTQAGILKGKYRYMAPEQAEGRAVDQRTDLFSVGIVLYELLAGQVHGRGLSDMQLLERVRSAQFEPLRALRPEVPPVLDEIVARALERDPARRFQNAQDFQDALSGFLHATGIDFAKRDLGAMVRRLFPEGEQPSHPVDENQTVSGTPSSRLGRDVFQGARTGAAMTTVEREDELEELADDDLEELDANGAPRGAARAASGARAGARRPPQPAAAAPPPETLDQRPRRDVAAAAAPTAEHRLPRPARRRGAREVIRAPGASPPAGDIGGRTSEQPLGLRVPVAEPFEEPRPPEPPRPVLPEPPRPVTAPRPVAPPPRAPAPAPVALPRPAAPTVAASAEPAAPRPGLSRAGKLAAFTTVLLLGGAGVGALLLYNPSAHQPRPRASTTTVPTGSLYVTSRPAGAAISINGKPTGRRTPDTIDELPANRSLTLELSLDGFQPWSLEVSVSGDDPTPVMAELSRVSGGRAPKGAPGRDPGRRRGPP
jgi:eukaryotic-like serine/threonine-protein kinase